MSRRCSVDTHCIRGILFCPEQIAAARALCAKSRIKLRFSLHCSIRATASVYIVIKIHKRINYSTPVGKSLVYDVVIPHGYESRERALYLNNVYIYLSRTRTFHVPRERSTR